MMREAITSLLNVWRSEVQLLQKRGSDQAARTLASCASDLEAWAREYDMERLSLEEAAAASGFSYSSLQRYVKEGTIPNAGHRGRPRIHRRDLPKKPGRKLSKDDLVIGKIFAEKADGDVAVMEALGAVLEQRNG